jgi:peptide/nickel transport system ATP-binding protein
MTVIIENLTVTYPQGPVISGVSLRIAEGEVYGLVGESGSGKSTVAAALTHSIPGGPVVEAAGLSVAGNDVLALKGPALRQFRGFVVGVVHQEPGQALDPTMTVGAQAAEVFRLQGSSRRAAAVQVREAFERVGLPDPDRLARRYPHELSGGQQQRVVIASALATRPRLLVLDEPTTGLDRRVEADVLALIVGLRAELGFATLLISHNLPLVAAQADRIGVLEHGRLVEEGPAATVFAQPQHPYTHRLVAAIPDPATGKPLIKDDESSAPTPVLTVRSLTKRYGSTFALHDVELTVGRGEIVGLVGGSGSGKTTLGRSVAGLLRHEGDVELHSPAGRPGVQVVFQNPEASLNPHRTVRQVLTRSVELLGGSSPVTELAASVGLGPELLDRRPNQLSGGQKQRVAIARAFAGPVPLVVLDEPTSALDVSVQARILDLLLDLQLRSGVALLFITHDLAVVRQLADRIGVLDEGRLVEIGTTEQIFTAPAHPATRALLAGTNRDTTTEADVTDRRAGAIAQ